MLACVNHPDKNSVAICVKCGNEICIDCRTLVDEKSYCPNCAQSLVTAQTPVTSSTQPEALSQPVPLQAVPTPSVSSQPPPAQGEVTQPEMESSTGLSPNIAGLLCYLLGWLTGLIFVLIEHKNKFVRFHAFQSLIFFGALQILQIVIPIFSIFLRVARIPFIPSLISMVGWILGPIGFIFWIVGMIKAYGGEVYKFPIVGDLAEKYI